jgi:dTDP-4-dehydrorhamnose 3,5-epimerase
MPFRFHPLPISGAVLIESISLNDVRGTFRETYRRSDFEAAGIRETFVQANHSLSTRGVLRGLHYQQGAQSQGKLVRVVAGSVFDVCVDLRSGSPTFGQSWATVLVNDGTQVYLPPGCAHGVLTLSETSNFEYLCTAEYDPVSEAGIAWNDPNLAIAWPLSEGQVPLISARDRGLPKFWQAFPQVRQKP